MSIELLKKAVKAYYLGKPIMTDQDYDNLYFEMKKKYPKDKFFKQVGTEVTSNKIKLSTKRGSLVKMNPDNISNWLSDKAEDFVVTPKYDGLSITFDYDKNGNFIRATTRGDGYYGQDVSDRVVYFKGFVKKINPKSKITSVTGEAIISIKDFTKYSKKYSSPRNLCVGKLKSKLTASEYRLKSTKEDFDVLKDITFIAYTSNLQSKLKTLTYLNKLGFITAKLLYNDSLITSSLLTKLLKERDSKFECDGIVIDINSDTCWNDYGYESDGITPSYAVAVKPTKANQESAEAEVLKINWQVNQTGNLIPVAVLKQSVKLKGASISNISLANFERCKNEGFGSGCKVRVIRSGDVIPYCECLKPVKLDAPKVCPHCKTKLKVKGVHLHCPNSKCEGRKLQALQNFFTKMGIEKISYQSIQQLYKSGFNTIKKIMLIKKSDLLQLEGWKNTKATTLLEQLSKIKNCELVNLMNASGIFNDSTTGLGKTILQAVIDNKETKILDGSITKEDLQGVEHFGNGRIDLFMKKFPVWIKFYNCYKDLFILKKKEIKKGKLSGMIFGWTGFRDKALKEWIENNGGIVKDSLTKSTDVLFSAGPSTKTRKAEQYGIKVVSQGEAVDYIKKLLNKEE